MNNISPVELSIKLINCSSVTPIDAGVIDVLISTLKPLGFNCHKLVFNEVTNLYARLGSKGPNLCFAGHTDVVPPGDLNAWLINPFDAKVIEGKLYGRGAADMKAAIACFASAVSKFIDTKKHFEGSISFLITGDEEGPAVDGTIKVIEWMKQHNETIDDCIVGEPTSPKDIGEVIKIGRRGSINFTLTIHGVQGHVACPQYANNPITILIKVLNKLKQCSLDVGNEYFQPSNLEITSIDVGNSATNVIPLDAKANFNIRFNDLHTQESLDQLVMEVCNEFTTDYKLTYASNASPFVTPKGKLTNTVFKAIEKVTGLKPEYNTGGGTSDARFIKDLCPVIELGLINKTAHKVNEYVKVKDIGILTEIYFTILDNYFSELS